MPVPLSSFLLSQAMHMKIRTMEDVLAVLGMLCNIDKRVCPFVTICTSCGWFSLFMHTLKRYIILYASIIAPTGTVVVIVVIINM
jgi:hypothetical protein